MARYATELTTVDRLQEFKNMKNILIEGTVSYVLWRTEIQSKKVEQCLKSGHVNHLTFGPQDVRQNFVTT
jgi:hypothetical protein